MPAPFTPALFEFLRDLRANNDRAWFADNENRYQRDVEAPALEFIRLVQPGLAAISEQFSAIARVKGGSLGSVAASSRFAEGPFRPYLVFRFSHRSRKVKPPPMFYLRLAPDGSAGGGGMYHPDAMSLGLIRAAIDVRRDEWQAVIGGATVMHGESLTRVPRGFDADHPLAADLKRKGHVVMENYSQADVVSADFPERFVETCRMAAPLVRFLTSALGLAF
jgi:uncharacterized protein (TIGR02453 family)